MLIFECQVCRTSLSAEESQVGQLVRCPTCLTTLRVPASSPAREMAGVGAGTGAGANVASPPSASTGNVSRGTTFGQMSAARGGGKRYGFNCGYCSSRLEANEAMAGQHGQCPT